VYVVIIIPVYNRRETTIQCLESLRTDSVFDWAHVVVVDDASSDGTGDAVRRLFPSEQVTVLEGDGNLWWAGGIKMGMEYAYQKNADYMVWFNDDCRPQNEGALKLLLDSSERSMCISVGQARCPSGMVYGGSKKTFLGTTAVDCSKRQELPCETFAGNAVCFPRFVVDRIGFPDAKNFPMMADADYGFRATKAGIPAMVIGDALFENDDNLNVEHESFLLSERRTGALLKATFGSIKSFYYLPSVCRMKLRHYGGGQCFLWLFVVLSKYATFVLLRIVLSRNARIKLFGKHLRAWKVQSHYETQDGASE